MEWRITDSEQRKRVVLMASRESHCLAVLLHLLSRPLRYLTY